MDAELDEKTIYDKVSNSEEPWVLIESYFRNQHLKQLIRHQLESYNYFVNTQIENTIEMFNPVHICSDHDYIKELNLHRLEIHITFENFNIHRPQVYENNGATKIMFPQEARLRNFTYAGSMTVDLNIKYTVRNGENYKNVLNYQKILKNIHIGKLPIMLRSDICVLNQYKHLNTNQTGECKMDPGGYFIINGSEKTCLGQERAAENQIYCFNVSKNNTKWTWSAEMKCIPDWKCISPKQINIMISSKNNGFGNAIYLQIPRLKNPIPLFIIFRAFNVISDKDICDKIILNIEDKKFKRMLYGLQGSIVDANNCLTYDAAIRYITSNVIYTPLNVDKETGYKRKNEFAFEVINNDIFPHCKSIEQKIYMLGYMTNRLLQTSFEWIEQSDRDSYLNKRIDLTGSLINNLLRNYLNKVVKDMQKQVVREINSGSWKSNEDYENIINSTNIYKIIKSTTIENGIKRALATGDFGIKQINSNKVGVAQVLNRLTYISSISHLRRVNTPIDKSGKLVPPRRLHNSSWGFLCPAETPEGGSVGIVKNLSYMTHITIPSNSNALYDYILPLIVNIDTLASNSKELYDKVKVFINGAWVGITNEPLELYNNLKQKKYKGIINIYTSIIFDYKLQEIKICNDGGRLTRPLLKIKNNNLVFTKDIIQKVHKNELSWNDLLYSSKISESIIEYIDSYEQNNSMIAMEPEQLKSKDSKYIFHYTHCEIHPSTIFGILASCIPFPENNQSPRNTYQSAMGKQAIGMYVTNYDNRMDKTAYVLSYPMRPLVDTRLMNIIQLNTIPSGEQVIVAIMSHSGYNQEDSILFNKGSIDRGLFLATIYHTEKDEDKKLYGNEEIRCKPDKTKTKNMKFANYDKVNSQGVVPENTLIKDRDIIIAKVLPIKENKNDYTKTIKYTDESHVYRTNEETFVDKNYIECNGDGYNFCKVRLRNYRKPVIGDKFCIKENALILTEYGWISLKDIDINKHKVATLKNNKELDYVYAIEKYEFDCVDEELYCMKSQQVHMVCTKEHKLYIKKRHHKDFEFIEAKNAFGKRIRYKKDALNINKDIENFVLDKEKYNMDYFLMLLGSFISDGWVEKGKKYTRINIAMIKKRKRDFIENVLNKLNIHYNITKDRVLIGNTYKELIDYFKILSVGASNKYLPKFVWELSQRQSIILMNSLMQGDGSYNKQGSCGYYTSSFKLANQIQQLALHCGWSGTIKLYNTKEAGHETLIGERIIKSNYDNYSIRIVKTKNNPEVNHGHVHQQNIQEETYLSYTGKVGCIEVPDTHLFYYKEDIYSPPVWTGNSSRHGQKGTIGNIIPEQDMPFTADGLKPDIIINPHAIPSRMTIAQLKETLLGKVLVQLGLFGDGTSFSKFKISDITKELQKLGYESNGNEVMYNALSGEQMPSSIFIGPAFYQRLKHMVNDKQHSRSIGPMVNLTRQPAEGRARDGGLRFGEMERDCMISHGASRFTKGRLYDASDSYSVHICNKCGLIAAYNKNQQIHICNTCENRTDFKYVEIPYACKLMFQELLTMNIAPRLICQ
jgi:DNA-directed RNA polymerase II subunit RPB2